MFTQTIGFPIDIDQKVKSHESDATGYITITKNPGPLMKVLLDIFGISSTTDEKALRHDLDVLRKLTAKPIDEKLNVKRFRRQTTG